MLGPRPGRLVDRRQPDRAGPGAAAGTAISPGIASISVANRSQLQTRRRVPAARACRSGRRGRPRAGRASRPRPRRCPAPRQPGGARRPGRTRAAARPAAAGRRRAARRSTWPACARVLCRDRLPRRRPGPGRAREATAAVPRKTGVDLIVEAAVARLSRSTPGQSGRNCPWRSRRTISSVSQSSSGIEIASRNAETAGASRSGRARSAWAAIPQASRVSSVSSASSLQWRKSDQDLLGGDAAVRAGRGPRERPRGGTRRPWGAPRMARPVRLGRWSVDRPDGSGRGLARRPPGPAGGRARDRPSSPRSPLLEQPLAESPRWRGRPPPARGRDRSQRRREPAGPSRGPRSSDPEVRLGSDRSGPGRRSGRESPDGGPEPRDSGPAACEAQTVIPASSSAFELGFRSVR